MMKVEFQAETMEMLLAQIVQYLSSIKGINMLGNGGNNRGEMVEAPKKAD